MRKKNQINLDLSAILQDAGFTAPQINVLYSLLEENIIEAAKAGVGISVGTIFDIGFSRKAKNPLLIIKMRRRFAERVRYYGKKEFSEELGQMLYTGTPDKIGQKKLAENKGFFRKSIEEKDATT